MGVLVTTIDLDLKKLGLTHAKGKSDGCRGQHQADVEIDEYYNHDGLLASLQKLHELVHPHGTVAVEYCYETVCQEAMAALEPMEP